MSMGYLRLSLTNSDIALVILSILVCTRGCVIRVCNSLEILVLSAKGLLSRHKSVWFLRSLSAVTLLLIALGGAFSRLLLQDAHCCHSFEKV